MARATTSLIDGGGDSFYNAVAAVRSAASPSTVRQAEERGRTTTPSVGAAAPRGRTNVPSAPTTSVGAAAPRGQMNIPPSRTTPPGATEKAQKATAAKAAASKTVVDEQTKAKEKAAQAPKKDVSPNLGNRPLGIDPYLQRDPVTGRSPAQEEARKLQEEAAKDLAAARAELARILAEQEAARKAAEDAANQDNTGDDAGGDVGGDTGGNVGGDTGGSAGADITISGAGVGAGAGGSGPEAAAQQAILDQIKALTEQMAAMQSAAAAEAAKPKVVGTRTVRKTGGVVDVVEVMSDGSTGKVIESYKDFGARDSVMKMFENTGLGQDFIKSLMDTVDKVYEENIMPTEAQVLNSIYASDAYKTRFAANEIIRKRMADGTGLPGDRLLTPAEYIRTEQAYREIMSEAGLPNYFYDQQEDFTKLIGELGTSVAEVSERVNIAKRALQDADQNIKNALQSYYGWSEGDMVAYLLDPEKAFRAIDSRFTYTTPELQRRYQVAEVGGAATRAGMTGGISEAFGEEIRAAGKADMAERAFQGAARDQEDYNRLMQLYGEKAGTEDLAREALALAGGAEVGIKTRKLASKERAKFQQRSAIDKTSLGSRLRNADV